EREALLGSSPVFSRRRGGNPSAGGVVWRRRRRWSRSGRRAERSARSDSRERVVELSTRVSETPAGVVATQSRRDDAKELLSDADAAGFQRMLGALEEVHFRARLRAFVGEHCVGFAHAGSLEADGLGHPLEWTALHRQYQEFGSKSSELFDAQLEGFLAAEGVPREAFVALARSLSRARADYRTGWDAFLAEITASSDYGGFVALMRAAAEARRAEEFEASMSVEMAEVARDPAPDPRG
ncbi:unnamed protein product, partial [Prorocentrum cordatum]